MEIPRNPGGTEGVRTRLFFSPPTHESLGMRITHGLDAFQYPCGARSGSFQLFTYSKSGEWDRSKLHA